MLVFRFGARQRNRGTSAVGRVQQHVCRLGKRTLETHGRTAALSGQPLRCMELKHRWAAWTRSALGLLGRHASGALNRQRADVATKAIGIFRDISSAEAGGWRCGPNSAAVSGRAIDRARQAKREEISAGVVELSIIFRRVVEGS